MEEEYRKIECYVEADKRNHWDEQVKWWLYDNLMKIFLFSHGIFTILAVEICQVVDVDKEKKRVHELLQQMHLTHLILN